MPVGRAALVGTRLGFHHALATSARYAHIAPRCRSYASHSNARAKKEYVRRLRMPQNRDWYGQDGSLNTTPENARFLTNTNIAVDNGKAYRLKTPRDDYKLLQEHGINVSFHEAHLVHPYQLDFLNPRGHSTAAMTRAELLEKHNSQHLWSIITSLYSTHKAVVRNTAQQRLRASLSCGLERAGYSKHGSKEGRGNSMYGTVWLTLRDPMKYVNMPPNEDVGNAIVRLLEQEMESLGRVGEKNMASMWATNSAAARPSRATRQTDEGGQQMRSYTQRDGNSIGSLADAFALRRTTAEAPQPSRARIRRNHGAQRRQGDEQRDRSTTFGFEDAFRNRR